MGHVSLTFQLNDIGGAARRLVRRQGVLLTLGFSLLIAGPVAAQQVPEAVPPSTVAYQETYQRVLAVIETMPIIDNHSHAGFPEDSDVDAMASPPSSVALRLRADNPEYVAASRAMYGYPYDDATPDHTDWLARKKRELRAQLPGVLYFNHILEGLNVERALANRVRPAPYLSPERFSWVFFVDSLLFPFDNSLIEARSRDNAVYVPQQEKKLRDELKQEGLAALPPRFADYLSFATRLLEDNRRRGGIAIKFEIGYFRPLRFDDPPETAVAAVYAKYRAGETPTEAQYRDFQDFLFRYLIREAGRLHLPVHIHSAVGVGDFYSITNSTALNLENILRDPRYETTTFVLLHGGYPFQEQAIWLGTRKNVYLDSSLLGLYLYPRDFRDVLRQWLLLFPEKVMFGSDAIPISDNVGAEEVLWIAIRSARVALAAALAEMIVNHEVTEERALLFARGYLHDNAAALYFRQK